jgi:Ca-activated chloride channel family protein
MRSAIATISILLLPSALFGQGLILPRPCQPIACPLTSPCPPCRPWGPTVVRQSSDVIADLTDRVLHYQVTETFVNRGSGIGEADYIFPLPKGAAFQDLKLSINGEMVAGETVSADKARAIYEQIVRQQRDPALVEWMGYGMLRARIFPIAPGEVKKVVIRFQMIAEREGDALRVDYVTGAPPHASITRLVSDRDEPGGGTFTLTIPADAMYGTPYSPTHALATTTQGDRREVRVSGSASEITLLVPVRKSSRPAISVLSYAPQNQDGFALVTLSPPAIAPHVTPRDVTLVLDVSGSMSGEKIEQARAAGKQVLATLNSSDRFRLIDFSTDVRTFRDGFVQATRQNVAEGSRYLESLDASGSTNISGALDEALRGETPSNRLGLVLFVTDGEPTIGERDPEAIATRVDRLRGNRRIFSFGVGADLNAALVERLAVEGRGTAQFVRPSESVERAVSLVASRLANPVVTDVRIYADGVRLTKMLPSEAADIFAGQDYVLLARYSGSGSTRLRFEGQTANGPVSWSANVAFPSSSRENSFVARLWATQRIGYLSAEKRRNGPSREINDEIRELGERYAIPTEFTSYLVTEPSLQNGQISVRDMQLQSGNLAQPTSAAALAAPSAKAFEAARAAAGQRAATNLAAADALEKKDASDTKRVGSRVFMLHDRIWVDAAKSDSARIVRVKPFSDGYFRLIDAIPDLRDIFALGDKIIVGMRGLAIEITESGAETISDSDLKAVQSSW